MKTKLIIIGLLLSIGFSNSAFSQGINFSENNDGYEQYFLVGTLGYSTSSIKEKLKVEIFGGNWHNSNLGEDIYYISTRDGIKINHERHGGATSRYSLEIFDNGTSYDFVIHVTGVYPSIQIKSWILWGSYGTNTNTEFSVASYDTSGKLNITSQVVITDVLLVNNSGNVGIGEPNPNKKLVVNGVIGATEVKVSTTPNSDYVFEPDYSLLPLHEVDSFIQQNKHLPDIPSAEEFKENGVGLGEMDNMLLRKIEELTLYVIELKRENETQGARLDELESENEQLKQKIKD